MASALVKMVAQKANISEAAAQKAIDTVLGFLKDKLPDQFDGLVDMVGGSSSTAKKKTTAKSDNPLGEIGGLLGGLLGGKK